MNLKANILPARPALTPEEQELLSTCPPELEFQLPEPMNGFSSAEVLLTEMDANGVELNPDLRKRVEKIYELMERRQGENAVPEAVPSDRLQLPPCLLQSEIFAIEKPRTRGRTEDHKEVYRARKVRAGFRGTLTYSGPPMIQDHLWILIGVLEHAMGRPIDEAIRIYPRAFARSYLGWSDSKHSKKRLLAALDDLKQSVVTGKWADDNVRTPVTFIREMTPCIDGSIEIYLDASILHLFRGKAHTFLSSDDRRGLMPGLATWMLLFARSSTCKPFPVFARAGGFTTAWFQRICGASQATSLEEFEKDLLASLNELKAAGAIQEFSLEDGNVRIVKHGPPRRKAPSKPSFWATKKGRKIVGDLGDGWEKYPEQTANC